MHPFTPSISWKSLWLVVILFVLLTTACSAQPSATTQPAETSPVPPMPTSLPPTSTPLPPTLTPAVTPLPGAAGIMLTLSDLPQGFEWTYTMDIQSFGPSQGTLELYTTRFYMDPGWTFVSLTVASAPYEKIPENVGTGQGWMPVEAPVVGTASNAYQKDGNPSQSELYFIKGNVLAQITGPISMDTTLALAQVMEQRILQGNTDPAPITFPETLDAQTSAKYFSSIDLGICSPDGQSFTPAAAFTSQDWNTACIQMQPASQDSANIQKYSYAVYDPQGQRLTVRYDSHHGFAGMIFIFEKPGNFELRIALDDVLVAVIPYEMR